MSEYGSSLDAETAHDSVHAYHAATRQVNVQNVAPGYKPTEAGVIPEEWSVRKIGDIAQIKRGASPRPIADPKWFDAKSDIGWLRISDVAREGKYVRNTEQNLSSHGVKRSRLVAPGHVIMSMAATVGRPAINYKSVCIHDGFVVFDNVNISLEFFYYLLLGIESKWTERGQTGSQINLNTQLIGSAPVPVPETPREQRAIAGALSDADALIESLDRLIAKKGAIKQAAMQQLLTGQTRLPGFGGEWGTKQLKDIAELHRSNITPSSFPDELFEHFSLPAFDVGQRPIIEYGAMIGSSKFGVPENAVLVSKLNPRLPRVWKPEITTRRAVASTEFLVLTPKGNVSRNFLFMLCASARFGEQMERSVTGTTGSHQRISPRSAMRLEVLLPLDEGEQNAVAAVIDSMVSEIEALSRRREKAKQVKQGMMQQLLTGRVRLV